MDNDIIKLFSLSEDDKARINAAAKFMDSDMFTAGNNYSINININDPFIAQYVLTKLLHMDTSYYGFNITSIACCSEEELKADLKKKLIATIESVIDN